MSSLALWGAGGHGRVVLDIAVALNRFPCVEFLDEDLSRARQSFCGYQVFASAQDLTFRDAPGGRFFVISIGSNTIRARCAAIAKGLGWEPATLIHPSAVVSPSASIGAGTVVMPRAVVNAGAVIGEHCIINSGAVVEHDCQIGDFVHVSPGVLLGGTVAIAAFAHMGLGSIALPGSVIGSHAIVGAGAVVLRAVGDGETVAGVPARSINNRKSTFAPQEVPDEHTALFS